jgi:hypothetical protein
MRTRGSYTENGPLVFSAAARTGYIIPEFQHALVRFKFFIADVSCMECWNDGMAEKATKLRARNGNRAAKDRRKKCIDCKERKNHIPYAPACLPSLRFVRSLRLPNDRHGPTPRVRCGRFREASLPSGYTLCKTNRPNGAQGREYDGKVPFVRQRSTGNTARIKSDCPPQQAHSDTRPTKGRRIEGKHAAGKQKPQ